MKTRFVKIMTALATIMVAFSCNKKVGEPVEQKEEKNPEAPAFYKELVKAGNSGLTISSLKQEQGKTGFVFSDESAVTVTDEEFAIDDCTVKEPQRVSLKDGFHWFIGDRQTTLVYDSESSLADGYPVYAYFNDSEFVMYTTTNITVNINIKVKTPDPGPGPGPEPQPLTDDDEEKIEATIEELAAKAFPEIYINTDGRSVTSKEDYVENCTITFKDPDGRYTVIAENGGAMKIKGRGNTTWNYDKKPWRVKLNKKTRVFGMPVNKNWALLANYTDKTLLRNSVAFEISRRLGMSWTPKSRACHVYMNDTYNKEYQYKGLYFITENKDVGSAKVKIDPIDPASGETDGDYYFEIDSDRNEATVFVSKYLPVMFIEPEIPSDAQLKYVKDLFATVESVLDSGSGFEQYLDIKSFMNNFIVQELCKNIDGCMRKSTFMVKHKGGKLEMYHVWDFDIALGNANFFTTDFGIPNDYTQWFVKDFCWNIRKDEPGQPECLKNKGWYWDMFNNISFKAQFKSYWQSVYPQLQTIPAFIDDQVKLIKDAQVKEQEKWHLVGRRVWPNVNNSSTYQGEIDYLKGFYNDRLKWLDNEISKF